MPDGDMYSKSVPRPWVKVSRLAFGRQDHEGATIDAVRVLSHVLSETDCAATTEAIQTIVEAIDDPCDLPSRRAIVRNLDRYAGKLPPAHVEALQRVARRALFGVPPMAELSPPHGIWEETAIRIGVEFLSELTMMNVAPTSQAVRLAQAGKTNVAEFVDQTEQFREYHRSDPGVQVLATHLVRTPASLSQRKSAPRVTRPRLPQRELLEIAIG
jgi:hypothetical protein